MVGDDPVCISDVAKLCGAELAERSGVSPDCHRAIGAHFETSEKDAKSAQKLGQLQPFIDVFPQKCVGQLASFGPT